MDEYEKDKETKKTSEVGSFLFYGEDEIETEGSGLEASGSEERLLDYSVSEESKSSSESSEFVLESNEPDPEANRNRLLKEKWLRVTGKKPKNIPVLRKPFDAGIQRHIFFGDRKPVEIEKEIRRKLLISAQKIDHLGIKFGKIRAEVRLPALFSGLLCLRFDPYAEIMACCSRKGGVEIRDSKSTETVLELRTIEKSEGVAVWSARFYPTDPNKICIGGEAGVIQAFNAENGEPLGSSECLDPIYSMDISPNGFSMATGGLEGKVHIIDPSSLQVISRRVFPSKDEAVPPTVYNELHRLRIYATKFHPTEVNVFVTGSWDNSVKIWDVRTATAVRYINGPRIYGEGVDLRDNLILTASWQAENSLSLWDFYSGRLIQNIPIKGKFTKFEGEFLYSCLFFKNHRSFPMVNSNLIAAGGSGFSALVVINLVNRKVEEQFHSFKPISCFDIYGNEVAYGGTESVFRIAEVELKH